MNKTKVLKEAFNRVNFLKKNPDLAGIIVGDGLVNRKKENFYPNGFGMIAWIFNEMYNTIDQIYTNPLADQKNDMEDRQKKVEIMKNFWLEKTLMDSIKEITEENFLEESLRSIH